MKPFIIPGTRLKSIISTPHSQIHEMKSCVDVNTTAIKRKFPFTWYYEINIQHHWHLTSIKQTISYNMSVHTSLEEDYPFCTHHALRNICEIVS